MITAGQRALIVKACDQVKVTPEELARHLVETSGVSIIDDLTRDGFELLMDRFTILMFRDRRRPILSEKTCRLLAAVFAELSLSDHVVASELRFHGKVGDLRDLTGLGLLRMLTAMEQHGLRVNVFNDARRTVTPKQLRLLHTAKKQISLAEDIYSIALQEFGGVNSAADLDGRGFSLIMAAMSLYGFNSRKAPVEGGFGVRPGFASPKQVQLIRKLWVEWAGGDEERPLNAWLERYHGVTALRFLTKAKAGSVITALKAMKRRDVGSRKVSA